MGVNDPYAAYCFDEAAYIFGAHVDGELARVSQDAKNNKAAQRKREVTLMTLLQEQPRQEKGASQGTKKPKHDPDDPVSPETAARMPPAKKFTNMRFQDPADRFSKQA